MPKARHRKRIRTARLVANGSAIAGASGHHHQSDAAEDSTDLAGKVTTNKKVGKKEADVANLLDKLRSGKVEERIWASSALSSLLLELPDVTLRLLLSKNLIGLLIERLGDSEDEVVLDCLGALRNLAVSSPPSIVSEMHNKRLLLPLTTIHTPLLKDGLSSMLLPPSPPVVAPLPSTASQRAAAEILNHRTENRRRLFWDWSENVFTLLWCLAETNTKILNSLNSSGEALVDLALAFLQPNAIGLPEAESELDMTLNGGKKGRKGKKSIKSERIPLFVSVSAAHALSALMSNNPPIQKYIRQHPSASAFKVILSSPISSVVVPTTADAQNSDTQDYAILQVLAFGIILNLTGPNGIKGPAREELRLTLKNNSDVLTRALDCELSVVVEKARLAASERNTSNPVGQLSTPAKQLASTEGQLMTTQLALEVLGEWFTSLDAEALGDAFEEEEEWGGIVNEEGDIDMEDMENDDDQFIVKRDIDAVDEPDTSMDEDGGGDAADEVLASSNSLLDLPKSLIALARPTSISFQRLSASKLITNESGLIPTSCSLNDSELLTSPSSEDRSALDPISEIVTTIHVRALESLNNFYITLSRSITASSLSRASFYANSRHTSQLQSTWLNTIDFVQQSVGMEVRDSDMTEEKNVFERWMEMTMAGVGALWGMARIGLTPDGALRVEPSPTPLLLHAFAHPFAAQATPAGESIRVRIIGVLGYIGRRDGLPIEENKAIGDFMLSMFPEAGKSVSHLGSTPEILLQAVESFIDLYSDEESSWDTAVFRGNHFLERIESAIPVLRGCVKQIDRKRFPDLRLRGDGTLENLIAFVQYRKDILI